MTFGSSNKIAPLERGGPSSSFEKVPTRIQARRYFRRQGNSFASTSLDAKDGVGEQAAKLSVRSGDLLAGESYDPTLSLIDYLMALLKCDDEEIDFEHIQCLLDKGADIHAICIQTGLSVLHTVSINWDSSVAEFLIEHGADVEQTDQLGRTSLHFAATADHSEMIECLLKHGCNIESSTHNEIQTPVHYAVRNNSLNALRALVEHKGNYEARDYSGRTPLHLAAELDRTYAAKYLLSLEVPAECRVSDNNKTPLLVTMIRTMPGVARMAMNQLQYFVPSERKQFFLLSYLEPNPSDKQARKLKTPFEVAVELERFEILDHPVIKALVAEKWKSFARGHFLLFFFMYLAFLFSWTTLIAYPPVQEKHAYNFPRDIWRILLELLALSLYFKQIGEEINEYLHSKILHTINKVQLIKTLKDDLAHTSSCFSEERKYLEAELRRARKSSPNYFRDPENYLDLITYAVLYVIIVLHLLDVFAHSEELAMWVARVSCIGAILIWVRLLKFLAAFKGMGPLIAIVRSLIGDIAKYFIIYGVFFVPYTICFFVLFGGSQSAHLKGAEDLTTYQRVVVMCFRMSLIDDYPFKILRTVDEYMAALLVVTFLLFTAMIGLNLFIALLSNTFKSIYDNAQANAEMQKAAIIVSMESKAMDYWYKRYLHHIHTNCNPSFRYYDDDDLPTPVAETKCGVQETAACTKSTQLAHEMATCLENHHHIVSEDLAHLSKQIKYFSDTLVSAQDFQEQGLQYLFQQLAEVRLLLQQKPPAVHSTTSLEKPERNQTQQGDTPATSHKYSTTQLLKEIFPSRHQTVTGPTIPQAPTVNIHHTQSPSHLPPQSPEGHLLPLATVSRVSLLDDLASQSSYVVRNHRRYRARDERDVKREQWLSKIRKVDNEM